MCLAELVVAGSIAEDRKKQSILLRQYKTSHGSRYLH
jgi:hypothetical protein